MKRRVATDPALRGHRRAARWPWPVRAPRRPGRPRRRRGVRARFLTRLPRPPPRRRRSRLRGHLRQPAGRHAALARVPVLGRRRAAAQLHGHRPGPLPAARRPGRRHRCAAAACCCSIARAGGSCAWTRPPARSTQYARVPDLPLCSAARTGTQCSPALLDQAPMPDYARLGPGRLAVRHRLPAGRHLARSPPAAARPTCGWPTAAWTAARSGPPAS